MMPTTIVGRRAEGGRTLGGVEHAEPAAGAGADVEQPAAGAERGLDQVDGARDLLARAGHGRGDASASSAAIRSTISSGGGGIDAWRCGDCAVSVRRGSRIVVSAAGLN